MKKLQIDKKTTKQVRIDTEIHKLSKVHAAELGQSLKCFVEGCLVEGLDVVPTNYKLTKKQNEKN